MTIHLQGILKQKDNISQEIFKNFKVIGEWKKEESINGALYLINRMKNNINQSEYQYVLKRVIRGVGSPTNKARAGFFTLLVGILKFSNKIICQNIIELAVTEFGDACKILNKEDSDSATGLILIAGAIIRSGKLNEQKEIVKYLSSIIVNLSKFKNFHQILAYRFYVELFEHLDENDFEITAFPILKEKLGKLNKNFDVNLIYVIIKMYTKYPNSNVLQRTIQYESLINFDNFKKLADFFFNHNSRMSFINNTFEIIAGYLANFSFLKEFWNSEIEPKICYASTNNLKNIVKLATYIYKYSSKQLTFILSNSFVETVLNGLILAKKKNIKLKETYYCFFQTLSNYCKKGEIESKTKLNIVHRLILYPGNVLLEKYINQKIVHQIICSCSEQSLIILYNTYKQIVLNKMYKNPQNTTIQWEKSEKVIAIQMMQYILDQKIVAEEWKTAQLYLLLHFGFFHTTKIIEFKEYGIVEKDIADQMKKVFFCSLKPRFISLENDSKMLWRLVYSCNTIINKNDYQEYIRFAVKESFINSWNKMYLEVEKLNESHNKLNNNFYTSLDVVFQILLMHMGLHLFQNPDTAEMAIEDLETCLAKSKEKKIFEKSNSSNISKLPSHEEPKWIEVVVDLFLHLLSQNCASLRHVVVGVFHHICKFLTLSSIHQILDVLNSNDGFGPLSFEENTNIKENFEFVVNKKYSKTLENNDNFNICVETNSIAKQYESTDEEISETETDKFRSAVSFALNKNYNDADTESIDLDQLGEEEGQKIDEILAEAFKIKRKSNINSFGKKHTKLFKIQLTAMMHFRVRVLDLINVYILNQPNLLITFEILVSLFNTLNFVDEGAKPVLEKIKYILHKITQTKNFSDVEGVTLTEIENYFTIILNKKFKNQNKLQDTLRLKCMNFVIKMKHLVIQDKAVLSIVQKHFMKVLKQAVKSYIKVKNSAITFNFLQLFFNISWKGVWSLSKCLVENGLSVSVRPTRRIQIFQILTIIYKNNQLIKKNMGVAVKNFKLIESLVIKYVEFLLLEERIFVKEFTEILNWISQMLFFHKNNKTPFFNENLFCNNVQNLRKKVQIDSIDKYNKFCSEYNLNLIKNEDVQVNKTSSIKRKMLHEASLIKKKIKIKAL